MTTEAIKNAILSEMQEGKSLSEAKLIVLVYISERIDIASEEIKIQLGYGDK